MSNPTAWPSWVAPAALVLAAVLIQPVAGHSGGVMALVLFMLVALAVVASNG